MCNQFYVSENLKHRLYITLHLLFSRFHYNVDDFWWWQPPFKR